MNSAPIFSESYRFPHPDLLGLVDAPNPPEMRVDPRADYLLLACRPYLLTLEDLAQPEKKLAGLRFNPNNRASGREKYSYALALRAMRHGPEKPVRGLPARPRLTELVWSPDGQRLAFVHIAARESQLWVLNAETGRARRVPGIQLNGCVGFDINWMPDCRSLVVLAVPAKPGKPPSAPAVPAGPSIQEHSGGKASSRTYQDLLKTPYDESLFEYYLTSQIVFLREDGSEKRSLTAPGLYSGVALSPSGQYLLASSLHRPYSYIHTVSSFPIKTEVLDHTGKSIRVLRDLPLEENAPPDFDAVRPGPRSLQWRQDAPNTVLWVQALDDGDARRAVEFRDQLWTWTPGQAEPQPWLKLANRYHAIHWGDGHHAVLEEGWWKTRKSIIHWVQPDSPALPAVTLFDLSSEDRYADPGDPLKRTLPNGARVLVLGEDGESIFLAGAGASPEGDRPFLDKLNLNSGQTTRLFRSSAPYLERPVRLLDNRGQQLLLSRESLDTPPNLCMRDLSTQEVFQLTDFAHPAPQLKGIAKEILRYKRADGVELTGTLYTPPGYDPEKTGRLPVLVWAYPGEFKSASAAGQIKDSPYRFIRPWWGGPLFFVMRGYAVLEDPTFPIIGEGDKEPNDTYIEQLVMDAQAAVDAVAALGIGDPERCAIGGHSYGAFTTANLLAHSKIFRAGIARSGAYNRTLTPFGFQAEERTFWEAREAYTRMSPFTFADRIRDPLLLIHGQEDNNPGTFPLQSERLYQALKGLGSPARLVTLPKESHGYGARESVLHVLWEMDNWLEKFVKNAPPRS